MATIFERMNRELEAVGRRAQAALDEGKLQIQRLGLLRQQDRAARELGLLSHRRARGVAVDELQVDALLTRLDGLETAINSVERQLAAVKAEPVSVSEHPAPAAVQRVESDIEGQ